MLEIIFPMVRCTAKLQIPLILACLLLWTPLYSQSCDNDSFIDLLLTVLSTNENKHTNRDQEAPRKKEVTSKKRTQNSELKLGLSFSVPENKNGYNPIGIDVAIFSRAPISNRLYLGASVSLYSLGNHQFDSLFDEFDKIRTNQDILALNFGLKYKIIRNKKFQMALGMYLGTMIFKARTFAQDNTCNCEG